MTGVDISHYQKGLTIWQLRDAGKDFVILKLTEGVSMVDTAAFDFYREAYALGFPVGCYCYSHAVSAAEAREEAHFLLDTLRGFPMPCGVFLDMEEPKQLALSDEALREIADAWCGAVRAAGYVPGIYGSEYNLWAKLLPDALPADCLVWVAHYGREPELPCDLWQSGDRGRIAGYDGTVDTNEARSERFRRLAVPPQSAAVNLSVMVLQLLMNYNGCWGRVDGIGSEAFFTELWDFTARVEGER